jgi:hypothetical protein
MKNIEALNGRVLKIKTYKKKIRPSDFIKEPYLYGEDLLKNPGLSFCMHL